MKEVGTVSSGVPKVDDSVYANLTDERLIILIRAVTHDETGSTLDMSSACPLLSCTPGGFDFYNP